MENPQLPPVTFENMPSAVAEVKYELFLARNEITELRKFFEPKNPNDYLTPAEVADIFKCDITTVNNWTKKGKLRKYSIGNRVYYKRFELDSALKEI